jgi:signal transduction histidine kinase/DNA-binding response OmpR family regulator
MSALDAAVPAESDDQPPGRGMQDPFAGPGHTDEILSTTDWSGTPLGPVHQWPVELIDAVRTTMPSRMPMLIWWGPQLLQIYNEAYTPLVGNKHPRAVGQPASECWAEAWDELGPLAEVVLAGGGATYNENKLLLLDRHGYLEETYWTFSYSPIFGSDGKVAGVFVAPSDVTARVVGERRLQTVRELGALSATDTASVADACRAVVRVLARNRAAIPFAAIHLVDADAGTASLVASYGIASGTEISLSTLVDLDSSPIGSVLAQGRAELLSGLRERIPSSAFVVGPLGDATPDAAMLIPVTARAGDYPIALVALGVNPYRAVDHTYQTFFDLVTRQLSTAIADAVAYQAERHRAEALTELAEAKTRFFQNISHEFRTPLTLILGPLRGVLAATDIALPADHREALEAAERAALSQQKLVDTLLEFARAEADELHAHPEPTDLATLTEEVVSMFRSAAQAAEVALEIDTAGVTEPVMIDREMWARIVSNLLSNAVKYTDSGTIAVSLLQRPETIELVVRDTGVGISQEHLPHIFDRFHRGTDESGLAREGAGIGLALVSELVAAHRGKITVRSEPGQGSTFSISIPHSGPAADEVRPLEPLQPDAGTLLAEAPRRSAVTGMGGQATPGERRTGRLLLVEDNADLRAYLTRLLTAAGWTVTAVGDVQSAIAVTERPHLVLSDVMLPGRDGLELVRLLRANPELARIPVILLTARAGAEATAEGLEAGADDYVVKPFDPHELLARVHVHFELSQLREFALSQAENRATNLQIALASNRQIGAAMGIMMAQSRITEDEAFDLLRKASQNQHRKLRDVADEVMLTGRLPE